MNKKFVLLSALLVLGTSKVTLSTDLGAYSRQARNYVANSIVGKSEVGKFIANSGIGKYVSNKISMVDGTAEIQEAAATQKSINLAAAKINSEFLAKKAAEEYNASLKGKVCNASKTVWNSTKNFGSATINVVKTIGTDAKDFGVRRVNNVKDAGSWVKDKAVAGFTGTKNSFVNAGSTVKTKLINSKNWTIDKVTGHPYWFTSAVIASITAVYFLTPQVKKASVKVKEAYSNWKKSEDEEEVSFEGN